MAKKGINKISADSKKIVADLEKASARFEANKPTTSAKQTSNFTYGTGNPLSDVGFYAASGKTPTSSLPDTSDEATDFEPGGFTPVVYGGTITLPNGDVVEVASGQRQGPVDNYGDPGDINNNPIDPTFKAYDLPKKPDDKKPDDKTSKDLSELNAYALLEELFTMYGLEELIPVIQGYMASGVGAAQAKILLKTNEVYKTRFKGNELRVAQGLNAISEAEYLALENDYSETLRAYGVSDFFGPMDANGRKARTAKMAEVIGFDLSANQFNERISTAVTRVKNADAGTKNAFASLYGVTDSDLVAYFLNPEKTMSILQRQFNVSQTAGALTRAGFGTTMAEELTSSVLGGRPETVLDYGELESAAQTAATARPLSMEVLGSEGGAVAEQDLLRGVVAEDVQSQRRIQREQQRRLAEYQAGGSMIESQQGVLGLRSAAR